MIYASIIISVMLAYIVEKGKPKIVANTCFVILVLFMVFVTGMRAAPVQPCDEMLYRNHYTEMISLSFSEVKNAVKEPGWWILNWILANSIPNSQVIIFLSAFVTHTCSMLTLKREKHFIEGVFLYFVVGHFWASTNGMRQYFVIGILLLILPWIAQKKWKAFFVIVALLSTIHASILVMIPVYCLCQIKADKKWICVLLGGTAMAIVFFDAILSLLEGTIYNEYYAYAAGIDGTGLPRIMVWVCVTLFILKYRTSLQKKNKFYNVCIHWVLLASATLMISGVFKFVGRFNLYFSIAYLVILPVCFDQVTYKCNKYIYKSMIYGLLFIYYLYEWRNYNYTNLVIDWWRML